MGAAADDDIALRDVIEADLPLFFAHQSDPDAQRMAVFSPRTHEAFMKHWREKILANETVTKKAILVGGQLAGYVVSFDRAELREVGYWLGKSFWGRGGATRALAEFLAHEKTRPLFAIAATSNLGSIRVLEKCGFSICGRNTVSDAEGVAIEEVTFSLSTLRGAGSRDRSEAR